ncbi:hypothetical protein [Bradyrhizobium sp. LA7.1]
MAQPTLQVLEVNGLRMQVAGIETEAGSTPTNDRSYRRSGDH